MGRPRLVKRTKPSALSTDELDAIHAAAKAADALMEAVITHQPSNPQPTQKPTPRVQESIADAYLRALNDNASLFKDQLASSLITSAIKGDTTALKEINDRILGKNNAEVSDKEDYTLISDDRVMEIFQAWQDTKAYFQEITKPQEDISTPIQ